MGSVVSSGSKLDTGKRKREEKLGTQLHVDKARKLVHSADHRGTISYSDESTDREDAKELVLSLSSMMPDAQDSGAHSYVSSSSLLGDVQFEDVEHHKKNLATESDTSHSSSALEANNPFDDIFEDLESSRTPSLEPSGTSSRSSPLDSNNNLHQTPPKSYQEPADLIRRDVTSSFENPASVEDLPSCIDPRAFFDPYRDTAEDTAEGLSISYQSRPEPSRTIEHLEISGEPVIDSESFWKPQLPETLLANDIEIKFVDTAPKPVESAITDPMEEIDPPMVFGNSVPVVEIRASDSNFTTPGILASFDSLPTKLIAERLVFGNVEYLVQWANNTQESWIAETAILRIAPDLVDEWKVTTKSHAEAPDSCPVLEDIVERILATRKVKGVQHYLVKWQGYPEVNDRTWEPCDRLRTDVPLLVNEYELGQTKKKQKKK